MTQLDFLESKRLSEHGQQQAEDHAAKEWLAAAESMVLVVAKSKTTFTTDDVWATGLPKPHEPRALGAVMSRLARGGAIVKTGAYVKTAQTLRHNAPIAVWMVGR